MENKILLFEDIDASTDVVMNRAEKGTTKKEVDDDEKGKTLLSKLLKNDEEDSCENFEENKFTLSDLLNCIDGIMELSNCIMVFTTNHPEKLDPALIRHGRISRHIELGFIKEPELRDMLNYYYGADCLEGQDLSFVNDLMELTPAKVESLCLENVSAESVLDYLKMHNLEIKKVC
jgi:chaperone BCS1